MNNFVANMYCYAVGNLPDGPRIATLVANSQREALQISLDRTRAQFGDNARVMFLAFLGKLNMGDLINKEALKLVCLKDQIVCVSGSVGVVAHKMLQLISQQRQTVQELTEYIEFLDSQKEEL